MATEPDDAQPFVVGEPRKDGITEPQEPPPVLPPEEVEALGSIDEAWSAYQKELEGKQTKLREQARAAYRAMDGWMPQGRDEAAWLETCEQAAEQYQSGRFLIERLGAERFMDPPLMATIWTLRQQLLDDVGVSSAGEAMLVDLAILSYYNALRIQGWIGNLALHVEHEFFGLESPSVKLKDKYGSTAAEKLRVEDTMERFVQQLLPLLDRSNRLVIKNLQALRQMRQGPSPQVSIGAAGQVNVAERQQNVAAANGQQR